MDLVKTRIRQSLSTDLASAPVIQDHQTTLQADGIWPDIDYASTAYSYWPPRTHLDRMKAMAKVYAWGSLQGDTNLRDDIFKAYDAWIIRDPQSPNWWYQGISTPQYLGEVLLLMGNEVSAGRLASGLPLIARAYVPRSTNSGTNTGANRTERAYASMMRGLLANDIALTTESFLAIGDTILVNSANAFAEGIQADGSFQQHGAQSNNPAVVGNGEDPDADGESNLYEFATGQNPLAGSRVAPALEHGEAYLEFTYTRGKTAKIDGIVFSVEWSDDLSDAGWSTAGILNQNPPPISQNATTETLKILVPADGRRRFARLRISKP